jgi:hypothetical protein
MGVTFPVARSTLESRPLLYSVTSANVPLGSIARSVGLSSPDATIVLTAPVERSTLDSLGYTDIYGQSCLSMAETKR